MAWLNIGRQSPSILAASLLQPYVKINNMDGAYVSCMKVFHPAHAISLTDTSTFTKKYAAKCDRRTIKQITATINNEQTAVEVWELRVTATSGKARENYRREKRWKWIFFSRIPPHMTTRRHVEILRLDSNFISPKIVLHELQ